MFGVSGGELIILLVIGLIVLGPERLPRVANQVGGWLGQARRMTRVMKRQLEEELDLNDALNIKPPPTSRAPSTKASVQENAAAKDTSPEAAKALDAPDEASEDVADVIPRDDDDYSPAHATDEVGTGVGEEIYADDSDLAVTEADRDDTVAESIDDATSEKTAK